MSAPNPPCVTGQAVPSVMDYSTRAGPDGNCTNVVPNPHQYPYGIGIPAPAPPVAKQAAPMDPKVQFAASRVAPPAYVQNAAAPIGGAAPPQVQQASHPVSMGKVLDALSGQREAQLVKASDADIQALFAMKVTNGCPCAVLTRR